MIKEFQGPYRWLSNFYRCSVLLDGIVYPTVEHAYQAAKTNDNTWRLRILAIERPGDVKRLALALPIRPDWEKVKVQVMQDLLVQKFQQAPFKAWLLKTEGEIQEGNWWGDTFWGVCNGYGQNKLGKLIMMIRDTYSK